MYLFFRMFFQSLVRGIGDCLISKNYRTGAHKAKPIHEINTVPIPDSYRAFSLKISKTFSFTTFWHSSISIILLFAQIWILSLLNIKIMEKKNSLMKPFKSHSYSSLRRYVRRGLLWFNFNSSLFSPISSCSPYNLLSLLLCCQSPSFSLSLSLQFFSFKLISYFSFVVVVVVVVVAVVFITNDKWSFIRRWYFALSHRHRRSKTKTTTTTVQQQQQQNKECNREKKEEFSLCSCGVVESLIMPSISYPIIRPI